MIKLGNTNIAPNGYKKVMRGSSLVWKKIKNKNRVRPWLSSIFMSQDLFIY